MVITIRKAFHPEMIETGYIYQEKKKEKDVPALKIMVLHENDDSTLKKEQIKN